MAEPRSYRQLEVLVIRVDKPGVGFRWELREYGKGLPAQAGDETYASMTEARQAGGQALQRMQADSST